MTTLRSMTTYREKNYQISWPFKQDKQRWGIVLLQEWYDVTGEVPVGTQWLETKKGETKPITT